MANSQRSIPNILVTGTPGVGKSTLCEQLAERTGLEWLEVGQIAKDCECFEEYDEVYQCPVLDEEKLIDELEDKMGQGGKIVDYHGCDFFPERWFDIVFVLRTNNTVLYDRLAHRGYIGKKLTDNVQCEIFQTILEEAQGAYKPDIVHELPSNTPDDVEENLDKISAWVEEWKMRALKMRKFYKNVEATVKFWTQECEMKQVPHGEPTNIRFQRTKFSCHSDLVPGI